jgi:hypothetical protein
VRHGQARRVAVHQRKLAARLAHAIEDRGVEGEQRAQPLEQAWRGLRERRLYKLERREQRRQHPLIGDGLLIFATRMLLCETHAKGHRKKKATTLPGESTTGRRVNCATVTATFAIL